MDDSRSNVDELSRTAGRRTASMAFTLGLVVITTVLMLEGVFRVAEHVPRIKAAMRPVARRHLLDEQTKRLRYLMSDSADQNILRLDPELGWRYAPGRSNDTVTVRLDGQRGNGNSFEPEPEGQVVVAAWGDSFIFCNEVRDEACWLARWQARNASLLVRNFGVGGYGNDQALLRFRRTVDSFPPDIAILGFTEDDLRRLVNVYRRFVDAEEAPLFKPRFRLTRGVLDLEQNPARDPAFLRTVIANPLAVQAAGAGDPHYNAWQFGSSLTDYSAMMRAMAAIAHWLRLRYLDPDRIWDSRSMVRPQSSAFKVQLAIFERFAAEATAKGGIPLILLLPSRTSVEAAASGRPSPVQPLIDSMTARGLPFRDVTSALAADARTSGVAGLFAPGGHYSARGNDIVSSHMDSLYRAGALPVPRAASRSRGRDGGRAGRPSQGERLRGGA